jgi:carboxyl-terminal processing protease
MPRRNIHLIVGLTVVCLMCATRVSRYGRILTYAMDQIRLGYVEDVDQEELFQGALEGMMGRLDDYSVYIGPDRSPEFQESLDKQFGGVGIEIVLDPDTGELTVASPLVGTPAHEAGILAGDKILRVDGQSTQGLSLEDAQQRMRGQPGDPVTLTILHEGDEQPVDVKIVRAVIHVDTVLGDTRNPDGSWNYFLEGYDRIGYIRINSFGDNTDEELALALKTIFHQEDEQPGDRPVKHEVQALILDMRDNPGGMLGAAIGVCDLFIDSGVIVSTRRRHEEVVRRATKEGTYPAFPMAVLVNELTASASEIVAACLQDHRRAVVVGQRTYGKGSIQELIYLQPEQGMLKLTTASYWRPSGKNIQRRREHTAEDDWGVRPNSGYEVELDAEQRAKLRLARFRRDIYGPKDQGTPSGDEPSAPYADPQLQKAIQYLQEAIGGNP